MMLAVARLFAVFIVYIAFSPRQYITKYTHFSLPLYAIANVSESVCCHYWFQGDARNNGRTLALTYSLARLTYSLTHSIGFHS